MFLFFRTFSEYFTNTEVWSGKMHNITNEKELLSNLKPGDLPAFQQLYAIYSLPLLWRFKSMVGIDVIAEELLQDLFIKIWERRDQINPELPFRAYLYRIAERMIYDHYRKLTRETSLYRELIINSEAMEASPEEGIYAQEVEQALQTAIQNLPSQQQYIFVQCKLEGRSYEEMSQELGISTATVNTHITRASKKVKEHLLQNLNYLLAFYFLLWERREH